MEWQLWDKESKGTEGQGMFIAVDKTLLAFSLRPRHHLLSAFLLPSRRPRCSFLPTSL
jgi:hypothetical protein